MTRKIVIAILTLGSLIVILFMLNDERLPVNYGKVDHQLFLADNSRRPLIVALGGSEGGMVYAGEETQSLRDSLLNKGYHFLALAYFGTENTPKELDRINLNAIHDTIMGIARQPSINSEKIALIGASRGGELALNLASRYDDIGAIAAIVPSNVSLPARFGWNAGSSWIYNQEEVPTIPASNEAVALISKGGFYEGLELMLSELPSDSDAEIKVEDSNASMLLISASNDEVWPSSYMCRKMIDRFEASRYAHYYQHQELEGGHAAPLQHNDLIIDFLVEYFPSGN